MLGAGLFLFTGFLLAQDKLSSVAVEQSGAAAATVADSGDSVADSGDSAADSGDSAADSGDSAADSADSAADHKYAMLMAGLTIFVISIFVGVEVITKVPQKLHTPLMSGSNAISGITIVGAILVSADCAKDENELAVVLVGIAITLAMINVVGGFGVTHRMLSMFTKRKKARTT